MADSDRIVFPDEVDKAKADALAAKSSEVDVKAGDSNTVEDTETAGISLRNMITVPDNCPPGYKLVNGVCREVFE